MPLTSPARGLRRHGPTCEPTPDHVERALSSVRLSSASVRAAGAVRTFNSFLASAASSWLLERPTLRRGSTLSAQLCSVC